MIASAPTLIQRVSITTTGQTALVHENIPQNFTHLYATVDLKTTTTTSFTYSEPMTMNFNDDSGGSSYGLAALRVFSGAGSGESSTGTGTPNIGRAATSYSGVLTTDYWHGAFEILAYTSPNWDKLVLGQAFTFRQTAGNQEMYFTGVRWGSRDPIRKISWYAASGVGLVVGSRASLWGIP